MTTTPTDLRSLVADYCLNLDKAKATLTVENFAEYFRGKFMDALSERVSTDERLKNQVRDLSYALDSAAEVIDRMGIKGLIDSLDSFTVSHGANCKCLHCGRLKRARRGING